MVAGSSFIRSARKEQIVEETALNFNALEQQRIH
jgi:hypothetical protein